VNLSVINFY